MKHLSTLDIFLICVALVVCVTVGFHSAFSGLSDPAAKAVAENCSKVGQVVYIRITSNEILAECRKP